MFAWMRPNDLVWNYVVNNYLLGNEPPAHDILFWNNDTTRLPAQLHADFLDLFAANPFPRPGKLRVRGSKIDLGRRHRHVRRRRPHRSHHAVAGRLPDGAALRRPRSTFVLANGGHVQSLINPPGNKRSWFVAAPARAATPEAWLARRQKSEGSLVAALARVDPARARARGKLAPAALGSKRHPPLAAAPGTYVLER